MPEPRPRYRSYVQDSARWDGFVFRDGDIVIATPPKCGTTWMQNLCALLVLQDPEFTTPISDMSPWLDMLTRPKDEVFALLDALPHRRFIKTHTPLDGLPDDPRATYICVGRDPRDAAISGQNHGENMDIERFQTIRAGVVDDSPEELAALEALDPPPADDTPLGRFWHFMEKDVPPVNTTSSLRSSVHHYTLALAAQDRPNVVVVHYADLKADLDGEMRRIAGRLGIVVPEETWPALVEAATFERMRARADLLAPDARQGFWKANQGFFHSGTGGGWRDFFDDAAQARYDARIAAIASPEVIAWAHRGSRG
jgi:aryl sulfotransferase